MTTVADGLFQYGGIPVGAGVMVPFGPSSKAFFVDPANGAAGNDGLTPQTAVASVATAYAKTTSGNNDVVYMIGGATGDTLAATLAWSNDYTHLIGLSSPLPGVGQRCRIVGGATTDLTEVVTFSGDGCVVANVQIANFADADVDSGAMTVSGDRNVFHNCFIAGMGHATPGARAGSYSLKVTGSENLFERCSIGLDTIIRAAANSELHVSGTRNRFWDSEILSYSDTAGKFAVTIAEGVDRWVEFKDVLFHNFSANWAQALTDAITVTAVSTYYIILRGNCQFVGFTGISDVVTHIYGSGPAVNAGMYLSTQPTT